MTEGDHGTHHPDAQALESSWPCRSPCLRARRTKRTGDLFPVRPPTLGDGKVVLTRGAVREDLQGGYSALDAATYMVLNWATNALHSFQPTVKSASNQLVIISDSGEAATSSACVRGVT